MHHTRPSILCRHNSRSAPRRQRHPRWTRMMRQRRRTMSRRRRSNWDGRIKSWSRSALHLFVAVYSTHAGVGSRLRSDTTAVWMRRVGESLHGFASCRHDARCSRSPLLIIFVFRSHFACALTRSLPSLCHARSRLSLFFCGAASVHAHFARFPSLDRSITSHRISNKLGSINWDQLKLELLSTSIAHALERTHKF